MSAFWYIFVFPVLFVAVPFLVFSYVDGNTSHYKFSYDENTTYKIREWLDKKMNKDSFFLYWAIRLFFHLFPMLPLYYYSANSVVFWLFVLNGTMVGLSTLFPFPEYSKSPIYCAFWLATYIVCMVDSPSAIAYVFMLLTPFAVLYYGDTILAAVELYRRNKIIQRPENLIHTPGANAKNIKRFLIILCVVSLFIPLTQFMANTMIADNSYYITYSAIKKNDDYIGNSWSGALYHNGVPLTNGCTIQAGDVLTLTFKVCDNDSHPVSSSKSVTFMHINPETTQRQEFEISLTQNDGTFSGNTAVWTVIVTVKRFK